MGSMLSGITGGGGGGGSKTAQALQERTAQTQAGADSSRGSLSNVGPSQSSSQLLNSLMQNDTNTQQTPVVSTPDPMQTSAYLNSLKKKNTFDKQMDGTQTNQNLLNNVNTIPYA